MATVTSLGAGSGMDLEGLVTQLMAAERQPLRALQAKETAVSTKISALGSLKSKLAELQTAAKGLIPAVGQAALAKFASFAATVADTAVATATASTGAVAGSYSLNVIQLAQAQRFVSSAPPALTPAAGNTLSFSFATDGVTRNKTITLNSTNASLPGLRDAINGANMGVSATIVNGSSGAQLILTGEEGLNNEITLGGSLASALPQTIPAQNAEFEVNGIPVISSSNKVSNVLDGVTLNLAKPGTTSLTVTQDNTTGITAALNSFIDTYNAANTLMKTQGAYDESTKKAGPLQGNSTLRDAQNGLRSLIFGTTDSGNAAYQRLSDIGISVQSDGSLKLDSSKLSTSLIADAPSVANLVAKVSTAFSNKLENIVGGSGSIQTATDSANKIRKSYQDKETVLETRMTTIEARLRKQFSSLDTLLANLNKTSSYLAQQLSSLPGAS